MALLLRLYGAARDCLPQARSRALTLVTHEGALSRGRNHDAAYSRPVNRCLDQALELGVFDELDRVGHACVPSLRQRHGMGIDTGPIVEHLRAWQVVRQLKQDGL